MAEEQTKELETVEAELPKAPTVSVAPAATPQRGERRRSRERNTRRPSRRDSGRSSLDQRIISIRRVARVVAGGRRFSFSVSLVAGDRKGSVAVGVGKAADTALAIGKALGDAKKNLQKLSLTKEMSIAHDVQAKYAASVVQIFPTPGRGLTAGSSVRYVLELAGVNHVSAKLLSRSKNQLNNARAAVKALEQLRSY